MLINLSKRHRTHQSLPLQQRSVAIKHKHWSDAEEEQLTDAVEEGEEVGVVDAVAFAVPHPFHSLVQPYTDVWRRLVEVTTLMHLSLDIHSTSCTLF